MKSLIEKFGPLRFRLGAVVFLTGFTYLFSLLSHALISFYFGTGEVLDAYWLSLAIVGFFTFYVHPFREALVPIVFQKSKINLEEAGEALAAGVCGLLVLLFLSFLILWISMSYFSGTAGLLPAFFPYLFLFSFSETLNALLTSHNLVVNQSIIRLISAAGTILSLAAFAPKYGIYALIIGLLFGQVITLVLSANSLRKVGLRVRWGGLKSLAEPSFLKIFSSLLVNYFLAQGYLVFERWTMSQMQAGLLSAYQYAATLVNVVVSVLALPLINTLWPLFLEQEHQGDRKNMLALTLRSAGSLTFLLLACSAFVFRWRYEIVDLIFARGAFNIQSLEITSRSLGLTIFAAVTVGLVSLGVRVLVSQGKGRETAIVGLTMTSVGILVLGVGKYFNTAPLVQSHWLISSSSGLAVIVLMLCRGQSLPKSASLKFVDWGSRVTGVILIPLFFIPHLYNGHNRVWGSVSLLTEGLVFLGSSFLLANRFGVLGKKHGF